MVGQKADKKQCIDELAAWWMNRRVERKMKEDG